MFRNFKFCTDYKKFAVQVKSKLDEFKHETDTFNDLSAKYNLEMNFVTKWYNALDEHIQDK